MLQWLMKGLGMTKKKLVNLSKGEETIKSDCQSIEEPKGWRFNWRKFILLEPTAELIILVLLHCCMVVFIIMIIIQSMKITYMVSGSLIIIS